MGGGNPRNESSKHIKTKILNQQPLMENTATMYCIFITKSYKSEDTPPPYQWSSRTIPYTKFSCVQLSCSQAISPLLPEFADMQS